MDSVETPIETNKIPNKSLKSKVIIALVIIAAFGIGYASGQGRIRVSSGKIQITEGNVPHDTADYSSLWDALNTINTKYVDRPLDQQKLMYGAIRGMVAAIGDPYTVFFDPAEAKSFTEQLKGSFSGIGAEIGIKDDQLVIIAPLDDTPAKRAGILAGDFILAIDGNSTEGMTTDAAVAKIRGKAGTQVKLRILHKDGKEAQDLTITRATIQIKSVTLETKDNNGKKIAVIKVNQFGDDTKGLLDHDIDVVAAGNFDGLILDLRNNPGGYLDTAVSTISNWIDSGKIAVKEIGDEQETKDYPTSGVPRLKGMKTVLLVNGGSASASEIVAGALQDYQAATLVGEKTFGKGSVQELENLKNNAELKVTVAKWYTPKGRGIHKLGLEPDIKVELTPDDITNNRDPQMDKALELLK